MAARIATKVNLILAAPDLSAGHSSDEFELILIEVAQSPEKSSPLYASFDVYRLKPTERTGFYEFL
jgi:hypothetical protein